MRPSRKRLALAARRSHIGGMISREQWRKFFDLPIVEWSMFAAGALLLVMAVVTGPIIPGPNGVLFGAAGLSLILKSSLWAKRRYVKFKRWQPKAGRWTDWALRRGSAKRREELAKSDQPGSDN